MLKPFPLALIALVGACYPAQVHPTRVDPAFRLATALTVSLISDSSSGLAKAEQTVVPSVDFEASIGIRDTSESSSGLGLRLAATGGLSGFGGSAYAELPRSWAGDIDGGIGIQFHRRDVDVFMPYVQVGALHGTESSWFLRNGLAWVAARDSADRRLLWLPTIGWYRHRRSGVDGGLYVIGIVGNQPLVARDCILFECVETGSAYTRTSLIFGMTLSLPLETAASRR